MQERQKAAGEGLLSAHQVQNVLHVDRSTIYRMAEDGRLPAIKVGRQWRFPAAGIEALVCGTRQEPAPVIDIRRGVEGHPARWAVVDVEVAGAVTQVAADLLGVMMVVTDMDGRPVTEVTNPCPWFAARLDDPALLQACTQEWQQLAADVDLEPRFHTGRLGFECARAFVREGTSLVGMVLAGGIAPEGPQGGQRGADDEGDPAAAQAGQGLHRLSPKQRRKVLSALPKVAATLSRAQSRSEAGEAGEAGAEHDQTTAAPGPGAIQSTTSERNEP